MAKIRSHVVSRASCADRLARARARRAAARARRPSPGSDEQARLGENTNVLAALLEAALAALYLEHGFEPIAAAIVEAFESRIEYALTHTVDHKTELQETLARTRQVGRPTRCSTPEGPPHERTFTSAAMVDGVQVGVGRGRLEEGRRAGGRAARRSTGSAAAELPAPRVPAVRSARQTSRACT